RVQRFTSPALRLRVEHAQPARHDVLGRKGRAVVKLDPAAEMERVCSAIRSDVPALGEVGMYGGFRVETRQPVEDVCDRATRWDVGGERRMEGPWVRLVTRIDDGMAVPAVRSAARECRREQYPQAGARHDGADGASRVGCTKTRDV